MSDAELERLSHILRACWAAFDDAVRAARGKELRKGPRGGGRELEGIARHVAEAEASYAQRTGLKFSWNELTREPDVEAVLAASHEKVLEALAAVAVIGMPPPGPRGGARWPARYFARRVAYHVVDHAWEIEDRSPSAGPRAAEVGENAGGITYGRAILRYPVKRSCRDVRRCCGRLWSGVSKAFLAPGHAAWPGVVVAGGRVQQPGSRRFTGTGGQRACDRHAGRRRRGLDHVHRAGAGLSLSFPPDVEITTGTSKAGVHTVRLQFRLPGADGYQGMVLRVEPNPEGKGIEQIAQEIYRRNFLEEPPQGWLQQLAAVNVAGIPGLQLNWGTRLLARRALCELHLYHRAGPRHGHGRHQPGSARPLLPGAGDAEGGPMSKIGMAALIVILVTGLLGAASIPPGAAAAPQFGPPLGAA